MINNQTTVPVSPEVPEPVSPFSKTSKIVPFIIVAILIVLGGVAVFSQHRNEESTDQILGKVSDRITSLKFVKEKVEGSLILKDEDLASQNNLPAGVYPKISFSSDMVASMDSRVNYSGDPKASANLKLKFDNFGPDSISADADFLMPKMLLYYIKLNELTGVPIDTSFITGKWWKVDVEALAKNFAGAEADKLLESAKGSQLSKEQIEKTKAIFEKYKDAIRIKSLPDGKIEGAPAYHFSVVLEKSKLAPMLVEISDMMQKNSENKEEVSISDIEAALEMIDIKYIELFVHKRDYLPAQIKFSMGILNEENEDLGTLDMSFIIDVSAPVEIKAPADSTDILYLAGPIVQSSLEVARNKGKEAAIKANMAGLRAQAEIFYDSNQYSYSGFCSSKELKSVRAIITEEGSGGTGFVCREKREAYAIGVNFPQKISGSWCVDSAGAAKVTATLPSGTVCPSK